MRRKQHQSTKRTAASVILFAALIVMLYTILNHSFSSVNSVHTPKEWNMTSRFAYLAHSHSNLCAASTFIYPLDNSSYIQGSCCSAMNFSSYVTQVENLRNFSDNPLIPSDSYNISVSFAKMLLSYENLTLTQKQQETYDAAANISENHGPCCCKCWRWYAFEGQAKYLISKEGFNATQIAKIWNLEDGCGGSL